MPAIEQKKNNVVLRVKVQPKSKQERVVGIEGSVLKIRVNAPPEKGKANEACIKLLSKVLKVPKGSIELIQGQTSKNKVFSIRDITSEEVKKHLGVI